MRDGDREGERECAVREEDRRRERERARVRAHPVHLDSFSATEVEWGLGDVVWVSVFMEHFPHPMVAAGG